MNWQTTLVDTELQINYFSDKKAIISWLRTAAPNILEEIGKVSRMSCYSIPIDVEDRYSESDIRLWIIISFDTVCAYMCPIDNDEAVVQTYELVHTKIEEIMQHRTDEMDLTVSQVKHHNED